MAETDPESSLLLEDAVQKRPATSGRSRDVGDETARNYRYQHSYGLILLASACRGERQYRAIWCEHHEDILAERDDGKFDGWQVKTRRPESGAWTTTNSDFVAALKKFVDLVRIMGETLDRLYFVSNAEFAVAGETMDPRRLGRSPIALMNNVHAAPSLFMVAPPFDSVLARLAETCGVSPDCMFETLRRVHLVKGPSRGEIDATLSNEHLARIDVHAGRSTAELNDLRDHLVGLIARASSLHVTSPERHLRALSDPDAHDPALVAKRISIEAVLSARASIRTASADQDIAGLHVKLDDLMQRIGASSQDGGLNRVQVAALLHAFAEVDANGPDAMALLLRKAEELRSLQADLANRMANDPCGDARFGPVLTAFNAGDFDGADAALDLLAETGAAGRDAVLNETARLYAMRGSLAAARLRYEKAAEHFGAAAAIARVFDKVVAFELLGMQAEALMDHALLNGGLSGYGLAVAIHKGRLESAPPNSKQRYIATGDLVGALGLASERAAAPESAEMIMLALDIARMTLRDLDPDRHEDLWLPLANNLGGALNNAARLAETGEQSSGLAREAVTLLTRAAQIARPSDHRLRANIETNLATAHRLLSNAAPDPRPDLKNAIAHRLQALVHEATMPRDLRGNAYDSLGNDYAGLAAAGPVFDHGAFRCAMAAYRKALQERERSVSPINWARTQVNIATNYGRACRLSAGQFASRYGRASLARLDLALSVLSPENAPGDWAHASFQMAVAVVRMIDADCDPGTERIEKVIVRLADIAEFADDYLDASLVVDTLEMQAGMAAHLFTQRSPEASRLIGLAHRRLQPRMKLYRYTRFRMLFVLVDAQLAFMLGYLAENRSEVEQAITIVTTCVSNDAAEDEMQLVESARQILSEMQEMFGQMPK